MHVQPKSGRLTPSYDSLAPHATSGRNFDPVAELDVPRDRHRIGDVASAAGLTVRTLHYYEEIGLLVATGRTIAGHRWYTDNDLQRLYCIRLLRQMGLTLGDIVSALDDPSWSLREAMERQLRELDLRLEAEERLRARLARAVTSMGPDDGPRTEELLVLLEEMTMLNGNVQRRISILVYEDLEAAYDYLIRVFTLGPGQLSRDDTGKIVHGELHAGDGVLWLHPETASSKLVSPQRVGVATSMVALMVDDVDSHYRHAVEQGADIQYAPLDQPYGYREYSARDLEGGLWSFMKPLD
jgi:MerR family transcriptional regulator, thiopeptide resistance regulator